MPNEELSKKQYNVDVFEISSHAEEVCETNVVSESLNTVREEFDEVDADDGPTEVNDEVLNNDHEEVSDEAVLSAGQVGCKAPVKMAKPLFGQVVASYPGLGDALAYL